MEKELEHMKGDVRLGVQIPLGEEIPRVKFQERSKVWSAAQGPTLWALWDSPYRQNLWMIPTRGAQLLAVQAAVEGPMC